jgi:hypothetical protein
MRFHVLRAVPAVLFFAVSTAFAADVPKLIVHQGYLTDKAGQPVTASIAMSFGIYKSADGDNLVWEEDLGQVNVAGGHYTVEIGKTAALGAVFFNDSELYLEIRVKGKKMTPRQHIGAVPYAFVAQDVVGDIHPKSISMGGNTVIDSAGKWVGDANNVPGVKSVATAAPLSGGPIVDTGTISMPKADSATSGYLASTDWNSFAAKQNRVTGVCNAGFCAVSLNVDGTINCEPCNLGTVTQVNTGTGLTGGPITSTGSVSLDAPYVDGSTYDTRFVNTSGDAMTGGLSLPNNGLSVGSDQLFCVGGNIGIGTNTPQAKLDIRGDILIPMADAVLDCDGSATSTVGSCDPISDGSAIVPVKTDDNICTDSLAAPTVAFLHTGTKTTQCNTTDGNVIALLGTPAAVTQYTSVTAEWAYKDSGATSGFYDNGEDLFVDKAPKTTFFATGGGRLSVGEIDGQFFAGGSYDGMSEYGDDAQYAAIQTLSVIKERSDTPLIILGYYMGTTTGGNNDITARVRRSGVTIAWTTARMPGTGGERSGISIVSFESGLAAGTHIYTLERRFTSGHENSSLIVFEMKP